MEPSSQIRWSPPNGASLKLDFNGSVILNCQAASAFVIRDASGSSFARRAACSPYYCRLRYMKVDSKILSPGGFEEIDAPEVREHEANNPDVTPSSLGGCRFSAEEPLEIDDSTEDYPVSSCASNDLSK
ncbi:hypothetical protein ACFX15_010182 [Malus domestica]